MKIHIKKENGSCCGEDGKTVNDKEFFHFPIEDRCVDCDLDYFGGEMTKSVANLFRDNK